MVPKGKWSIWVHAYTQPTLFSACIHLTYWSRARLTETSVESTWVLSLYRFSWDISSYPSIPVLLLILSGFSSIPEVNHSRFHFRVSSRLLSSIYPFFLVTEFTISFLISYWVYHILSSRLLSLYPFFLVTEFIISFLLGYWVYSFLLGYRVYYIFSSRLPSLLFPFFLVTEFIISFLLGYRVYNILSSRLLSL